MVCLLTGRRIGASQTRPRTSNYRFPLYFIYGDRFVFTLPNKRIDLGPKSQEGTAGFKVDHCRGMSGWDALVIKIAEVILVLVLPCLGCFRWRGHGTSIIGERERGGGVRERERGGGVQTGRQAVCGAHGRIILSFFVLCRYHLLNSAHPKITVKVYCI